MVARALGEQISAPPSVLDEIHGARAAGALLVGDLDGPADVPMLFSIRYLTGFCCRFAERLDSYRLDGTACGEVTSLGC